MGLSIAGLQPNDLAEGGDGLGIFPLAVQGGAEVEMGIDEI